MELKQKLMGKPIKLADATEVYTPVTGTSGDSRYYVVGVGPSVRLAVRLNGSSGVSARVEGDALKDSKFRARLQQAGFAVNDGYASIHTNASDLWQKSRAVYAMIGLVHDKLTSPGLVNVDVIASAPPNHSDAEKLA